MSRLAASFQSDQNKSAKQNISLKPAVSLMSQIAVNASNSSLEDASNSSREENFVILNDSLTRSDKALLPSLVSDFHVSMFGRDIPFLVFLLVGVLGLSAIAVLIYCFMGKTERARHVYSHKGKVVYEWEQTPRTVRVFMKPPAGMDMRALEVVVWTDFLHVGRKGKAAPFLAETLYSSVDAAKSTWMVTKAGELEISMPKLTKGYSWPGVIPAHITHVRSSSSTSDYGAAAQSHNAPEQTQASTSKPGKAVSFKGSPQTTGKAPTKRPGDYQSSSDSDSDDAVLRPTQRYS